MKNKNDNYKTQLLLSVLLLILSIWVLQCGFLKGNFSPDKTKISAAEINVKIDEYLTQAENSNDDNQKAKLLGKAAVLLAEKGDIKKAMEVAEEGLRSNPTNADCLMALGEYRLQMGRFEEAAEVIDRSLNSNQKNAKTNYLRGNVSVALNDRFGAEDYYKQALEIEPDYALAANNLATLQMASGRPDLALDTIEKSLKAGAKAAVLLKNAGIISEKLGQKSTAKKYYSQYIEQNQFADDVTAVQSWMEAL
ncbi:MAG: tetratricopeptide repeat protein [Leptonema sp. (in: Bacteria)]|nr:tetratricopeptide repeat protein [Leptonema sp. (in: bacteria)]